MIYENLPVKRREDLSKYMEDNLMPSIRRDYTYHESIITKMISEHNILLMSYDIDKYTKLKGSYKNIEEKIKDHFSSYSIDDKIKERRSEISVYATDRKENTPENRKELIDSGYSLLKEMDDTWSIRVIDTTKPFKFYLNRSYEMNDLLRLLGYDMGIEYVSEFNDWQPRYEAHPGITYQKNGYGKINDKQISTELRDHYIEYLKNSKQNVLYFIK